MSYFWLQKRIIQKAKKITKYRDWSQYILEYYDYLITQMIEIPGNVYHVVAKLINISSVIMFVSKSYEDTDETYPVSMYNQVMGWTMDSFAV